MLRVTVGFDVACFRIEQQRFRQRIGLTHELRWGHGNDQRQHRFERHLVDIGERRDHGFERFDRDHRYVGRASA